MKTIFNNKITNTVLIVIFIITTLTVVYTIFFKKTKPIFPAEISVSGIEDSRGLGYSGQRKIAQDNKGNTYIAYRKKYQKYYEIFVTKISTGGQVSENDKPIATIEKANQRVPSIAIDSKGTIHVVWYGSNDSKQENNRQIKYVRSEDQGKTWSSWRNIAFVSGYGSEEEYWQEHPSLLIGKDDALYVVWEGKDEQNSKQQIKFIKSISRGNDWSSWKNISASANNTQSRPSLVQDQSGKIFLFAYSSQGQGNENDAQQIQFSLSSDSGNSWSEWQIISDPRFDSRHLSASIDSGNTLSIAWRAQIQENGPSQIMYRSYQDGQWLDIAAVSSSLRYQFFPNLGIVGHGKDETVLIAWMENDNPSELPRENPQGGYGFVSYMKNGRFQVPIALGAGDQIFYPGVPEKTNDPKIVPVVYTQGTGDNHLEIKVKFLDVTK